MPVYAFHVFFVFYPSGRLLPVVTRFRRRGQVEELD